MSNTNLSKFHIEAKFNDQNRRFEIEVFEKGEDYRLVGMIYKTRSDYGASEALCWRVYGDDANQNYYDTKLAVMAAIKLDQRLQEEVKAVRESLQNG